MTSSFKMKFRIGCGNKKYTFLGLTVNDKLYEYINPKQLIRIMIAPLL